MLLRPVIRLIPLFSPSKKSSRNFLSSTKTFISLWACFRTFNRKGETCGGSFSTFAFNHTLFFSCWLKVGFSFFPHSECFRMALGLLGEDFQWQLAQRSNFLRDQCFWINWLIQFCHGFRQRDKLREAGFIFPGKFYGHWLLLLASYSAVVAP